MVMCMGAYGGSVELDNNKSFDVFREADYNEESFDVVDLIITTKKFIVDNAVVISGGFSNDVFPVLIKELHNEFDEIYAYYIDLDDGSFLIVKASRNSPYILEFAYQESCYNIEKNKEYRYIHGSVAEIIAQEEKSSPKLNRVLDINLDVITAKGEMIQGIKSMIYNMRNAFNPGTDGYYGFIWNSSLPLGNYSSANLPGYNISYAKMSDFYHLTTTQDICGATSAYNTVAYFRSLLGHPISAVQKESVFESIGEYVGYGITFAYEYRQGLVNYIATQSGYNILQGAQAETWANYKANVENGRINYMVLWNLLTTPSGHTIIGIGYREYSTGEKFCRIVDAWNNSTNRYMEFNTNSALWALGYIKII